MNSFRLSVFTAAMAVSLMLPISIFAGTIVDTGEGTYEAMGLTRAEDFPGSSGSFQSLAGKFTLAGSTTITAVKGRLSTFDSPGSSLTIGIGSFPGDLSYSSKYYTPLGGAAMAWVGLDGLAWTLDAGDYWVTFAPNPGFSANMEGGAPHPLSEYAFESEYSVGLWQAMGSKVGLAMRIEGHSADVPEDGTTLTMCSSAFVMLSAVRSIRNRRESKKSQGVKS